MSQAKETRTREVMPKRREENQEKAVTRIPREMASRLGEERLVTLEWREETRA